MRDVVAARSLQYLKRRVLGAMLALLTLPTVVRAGCPTTTCVGPGFTIPDPGSIASTLTIDPQGGATIQTLTLTLDVSSAPRMADLDLLLVHPDGVHNIEFLSDSGGAGCCPAFSGTITLSDAASTCPPVNNTMLSPGTYWPSDYSTVELPAVWGLGITINHSGTAHACTAANGAATFTTAFGGGNNLTYNGDWKLYAADDTSGGGVTIITSWTLTITPVVAAVSNIGDFVWEDLNGNGVQDAGEAGINGVTVNLLNAGNVQVATTTTAGGGLYNFASVAPGTYSVEFVAPATYAFTLQDQGADDTKDSDANPANGRTAQFVAVGGVNYPTMDAGLKGTVISDEVFGDLDQDGIQDAGEVGIDGVVVHLLNASNMQVGSTTTAGGGIYRFANVAAGTYSVEFVAPSGFSFSPKDQGGDDTLDSDADPITGRTAQFAVTLGQTDRTRDAGLYVPMGGPVTYQGGSIAITDMANASPYPSTISVGGLGGVISKVRVGITAFQAFRPDDVDMLLVHPDGTHDIILWSDVGGNSASGVVTVTLEDAAGGFLPDAGPLATGTFKPTNEIAAQDAFPGPAPAGTHGNPGGAVIGAGPSTFATQFNGLVPNGTWSLYALDDAGSGDAGGSIAAWALEITTVCVDTQAPTVTAPGAVTTTQSLCQ